MDSLNDLRAVAADLAARLQAYSDHQVVPLPSAWYEAGTGTPTEAPPPPPPPPPPVGEVLSAPSSDLAAVVAARPNNHVFRLTPGTYRFHDVVPKDGMQFLGDDTDTVIVNGAGYENAFHGTASNVTIRGMTFEGFDNLAGTSAQNQSPIRGTSSIWATTPGTQQATGWLIEDIVARDNAASGLFLGWDFTVRRARTYRNGVTGIGGALGYAGGALLEDVETYENGANAASGAIGNGGGVKFTSAGTTTKPVTFRRVHTHHNKHGLWGDIGCRNFVIEDLTANDHVSAAVVYELSDGIHINGGTVERSSTWQDWSGNFNAAAINIAESRNALVEGIAFKDCVSSAGIRQNLRPHRPAENFLDNYQYINTAVADVTYRNCTHEGVQHVGLSIGTTGSGIADLASIAYEGNSYVNPGSMTFWWNGSSQTWSQWQAAGRQ